MQAAGHRARRGRGGGAAGGGGRGAGAPAASAPALGTACAQPGSASASALRAPGPWRAALIERLSPKHMMSSCAGENALPTAGLAPRLRGEW